MLKLENRTYSRRYGTYNACWLNQDGSPAIWGNYCPTDGSYYLAAYCGILASGNWYSGTGLEEDAVFQTQGVYNYEDVRRALQLGVLESRNTPINIIHPEQGDFWDEFVLW